MWPKKLKKGWGLVNMFLYKKNITKSQLWFWLKFSGYYLLIIAIGAGFLGGFYYGKIEAEKVVDAQARVSAAKFVSGQVTDKNSVPKFLTKDIKFNLYWDVWRRLVDNYVDAPLAETKLFYGSLAGMAAAAGDPYTMFFDPEMAFKFQQELSGNLEGIGAEIGFKKGFLTIIAPLPNTPAEKAGLRAGDKIYFIDKVDATVLPVEEAVKLIRGPQGSVVSLKIGRPQQNGSNNGNGEEIKDFKITREKINIVSVTWEKLNNDLAKEKNKNIAYLKIRDFNTDTAEALDKITPEILNTHPDAIILDLRNNPGGFLDKAISVAGKWVDNKVVVLEKTREGNIEQSSSNGHPSFLGIETVVLINGGSASASEIVAGALQDYKLATLIGETSFGKGSVQDYQQLADGSALKITIAKWLTPNKRSIDGNGIVPDIEVKFTEQDYNDNKDPQLDKAVEFLMQ